MTADPSDADQVSEEPAEYEGKGAKRSKHADHPPLAPDGLPWPAGYFDCPVRLSLEEAMRRSGVRPNYYRGGRPVYTQTARDNPNFNRLPDESQWAAELLASAQKSEHTEAGNDGSAAS